METPFEAVYDQFLASLDDYKLAKMDVVSLEENLFAWLKKAISYYPNPRKNMYDYDTTFKAFNEELNGLEIDALARYMVMFYLDIHLMKEENLSQALNSKDYRMYSPANQLKALRELKGSIKQEGNVLAMRNSYNSKNMSELLKRQRSL